MPRTWSKTGCQALDGLLDRLCSAASVADVGCGLGASTIISAQAFQRSTFAGFDTHDASIVAARDAAEEAGVQRRTRFDTASAEEFPGTGHDVVFMFDCLPRPRRPDRGCASGQKSLAPDGTLVLLEPRAGDRLEDNLNPVGRTFYGLPTMICTPNWLSQEVGRGLGAQAGEVQLRAVLSEAGFTTERLATETPFNLILEARP